MAAWLCRYGAGWLHGYVATQLSSYELHGYSGYLITGQRGYADTGLREFGATLLFGNLIIYVCGYVTVWIFSKSNFWLCFFWLDCYGKQRIKYFVVMFCYNLFRNAMKLTITAL